MKKYVLAGAGVALLCGCQTMRNVENPFANAYSELDRDGDGVISQQEAQSLPSLSNNFRRVDTNTSGGIDEREYKAAAMHIADLRFDEVDVNGDGVISEREAGGMRVSLKEAFDDVDTDGDNNVSRTEYGAATTNLLEGVEFSSLDQDGDGVIGDAEADNMPVLSEAFDRIDTDGDGLITEDELVAARR